MLTKRKTRLIPLHKYTIAERQETDGNLKVKVLETYNDGTKKTGSSPHEALPVFNLLSLSPSHTARYYLPLLTNCFSLNEFSMLSISERKAASIFIRSSTCVQLWMTVEWSRSPTSFPILEAGIFVYFCARYIDTCRGMTRSRFRLLLFTASVVT